MRVVNKIIYEETNTLFGEGLSFQQACAAIGRGECVQDSYCLYGPKGSWQNTYWAKDFEFDSTNGPWRIVPDPSKQVEEKPCERCGNNPRKKGLYFANGIVNQALCQECSDSFKKKPSLTYEQALECEKVRIHWPECFELTDYKDKYADLFIKNETDKQNKKWSLFAAQCFDLAERRGYRIEAVE